MHEALELDADDVIVFGYGKPIRARRLHPYADRRWRQLYGPPSSGSWMPRPEANRWLGVGPHRATTLDPAQPLLPLPGRPPARRVVT
jgi:type IV secretion system protein VirD4